MHKAKFALWHSYFSRLQLDIMVTEYTKVPLTWKELDFIPEFNRLYFISEGEGYIKVGDREYYPGPGSLIYMPAGVLQSYSTISCHTYRKYWCHFTAKVAGVHLHELIQVPSVISVSDDIGTQAIFNRLLHYSQSDKWTAILNVHAAMLELLSIFLREVVPGHRTAPLSSQFEKLQTVLVYIEEHLSESLSNQQLAHIAHFHPNYFIRLFKKMTGLSPIQYIKRKRMEKARQLLTHTSSSVSETADMLGMELAYFSRLFKEFSGLSPSEYKELHRHP